MEHRPKYYDGDLQDWVGFAPSAEEFDELAEIVIKPTTKPSDTLQVSLDTARRVTGTTYTKIKEIRIKTRGGLRVSFDLLSSYYAATAYARIYINGVAKGTERSRGAVTPVTFTEDIDGIESGDLLQIYARSSQSTNQAEVSNLKIKYDVISVYAPEIILD